MKKQHGYTLIECMLVLTIAAILFGIALPNYLQFLAKQRVNASITTIYQSIQSARQSAIFHKKRLTICAIDEGYCGKDWSKGVMLFFDENATGKRELSEVIINTIAMPSNDNPIRWKAFQNKTTLTFLASGMTAHQNGTFIVCDPNNAKNNRAIFITKMGRPRVSVDADGDGYHEDTSFKNLTCQ